MEQNKNNPEYYFDLARDGQDFLTIKKLLNQSDIPKPQHKAILNQVDELIVVHRLKKIQVGYAYQRIIFGIVLVALGIAITRGGEALLVGYAIFGYGAVLFGIFLIITGRDRMKAPVQFSAKDKITKKNKFKRF